MRTRVWVVLVVLLAVAGASLTGCSSRRLDLSQSSTQMQFGVRMARANLWREALFRFERAVQIDPANAQALNNLAVAYEGIGEFEKARDAYARALKVDKSDQHIQKNYSRFVEFYSRNRKREQKLQEIAKGEEAAKAAPAAEAPAAPVEVSRPKEPPKPGEIPVSDTPPDPAPPTPPPPPPGGAP